MTPSAKSRFGAIAQAVRERTGDAAPSTETTPPPATAPGLHRPVKALGNASEALRDHVARLERELQEKDSSNANLIAELERARALQAKAGDAIEEFIFLPTDLVIDRLPKDRLRGAFEGREFEELLGDIAAHGQNDAITVRRTPDGLFEVAAGRRRLEACRRLDRSVLARVRELDEPAMLRVQFSENERRADISALERARWFAEVRERLGATSKHLAGQFGIDATTFSLYIRLSRFPLEILDRLIDPRRLAILPARRVMEAIEKDPEALTRILKALDARREPATNAEVSDEPAAQIEAMLRAAEGRGQTSRSTVPERRHIVHQGRRIGTLTRNGGQWVFRFATSIPDDEVLALAERMAVPVAKE